MFGTAKTNNTNMRTIKRSTQTKREVGELKSGECTCIVNKTITVVRQMRPDAYPLVGKSITNRL